MSEMCASVLSIRSHPGYKRQRPRYGRVINRDTTGNVIKAFRPRDLNRRYATKLEALKTAEIRTLENDHFLFVQIATINPAPPLHWLNSLRIVVEGPNLGYSQFRVEKVIERGACPLNPHTSLRFELLAMDVRIKRLNSATGATLTVTTPDKNCILTGSLNELLTYGK